MVRRCIHSDNKYCCSIFTHSISHPAPCLQAWNTFCKKIMTFFRFDYIIFIFKREIPCSKSSWYSWFTCFIIRCIWMRYCSSILAASVRIRGEILRRRAYSCSSWRNSCWQLSSFFWNAFNSGLIFVCLLSDDLD